MLKCELPKVHLELKTENTSLIYQH